MQRALPALALACALALLPACSSDGDKPKTRAGGSSASPSATAGATGDAFVTRTANFFGPNGKQRSVQLAVHPAVKVPQGLLVEVDLTAEGSDRPAGSDYFCHSGVVCSDFGAASIVDPVGLVRYGPLRDGSAEGDVLSSELPYDMDLGVTYRAGALFPMPDGSPSTIDLDLQYGGVVTDLPVTDGEPPPDLLASPAAEPSPSAQVEVLPIAHADAASPYVDRHEIVAKVVGGTLGQGGSAKQGVVSLAADVLFAFDSADLTAKSQAVVTQAVQILAAKADPTKPVAVTGYTDDKGSTSYNASLSRRRAVAVAAALHKNASTSKLTLRVAGRGADDPVAPNARPDGSDDPAGRALNRRVELSYTPKAPPSPSPQPPAAAATPTDGAALATLQAPNVIGSGAGGIPMSAAVRSVRREGLLTLVEVTVTPGRQAGGIDYFSRGRVRHDVGAWRLVVPSTGAVHVTATDVDDETNVLGTYVKQMNGGRDYLMSFWTAAVPPGATSVDVDLGQLGTAKAVPVS